MYKSSLKNIAHSKAKLPLNINGRKKPVWYRIEQTLAILKYKQKKWQIWTKKEISEIFVGLQETQKEWKWGVNEKYAKKKKINSHGNVSKPKKKKVK